MRTHSHIYTAHRWALRGQPKYQPCAALLLLPSPAQAGAVQEHRGCHRGRDASRWNSEAASTKGAEPIRRRSHARTLALLLSLQGLLAATDIEEHLCCLHISLLLPSIELLRSEGRLIRRLCRPLWGSTRHHAGQAEIGTASAATLTAAEQALMQGPVLC